MPDDGYVLAALATILVVTFGLRALPFLVIGPLRESAFVQFLGRYMPVGIMLILVVYTLKDVSLGDRWHGVPEPPRPRRHRRAASVASQRAAVDPRRDRAVRRARQHGLLGWLRSSPTTMARGASRGVPLNIVPSLSTSGLNVG